AVTSNLLLQLRTLGAEIGGVYPRFNSLNARIPVRSLESAALMPGVKKIRRPGRFITNAGSVQSEGDKSMRGNELRSVYGLSGSGVKIGTISDSDDYRENSQSTGDLPSSVQVLSNRNGRPGTGEGTAMMELIHDVAPSSPLAFASGSGGEAAFAQTYIDLFNAGCSVINDDLIYLSEPAFQDGVIADAVNQIVAAGGIVFSSAGNQGNVRSGTSGVWEGDFRDSGDTFTYSGGAVRPLNAWFNGAESANGQDPGQLMLQWNDPWGNANTDYDLIVADGFGNILVFAAEDNIGSFPSESGGTLQGGEYAYVVKYSGANRVLRLSNFGGKCEYVTGNQTFGHMAADRAIGVAAIAAATAPQRAFNAGDVPEDFSSDGLRRIYYDANGVQIAPNLTYAGAIVRQKPTLSAPDRTMTTVPNFQPFSGTSAAAPHAAALTALLKQFAPDATPDQLTEAITLGAVDILTPGYDRDSGFGAISGRGAVKLLLQNKTLGVSPATSSFSGTAGKTLTINLGRKAPPSGIVVNVAKSGDTSKFTVPTSFTIPGGSQTKTFTVGAAGSGTGTLNLVLTENYTGAALGNAQVNRTVQGVTISSLALDRIEAVGGARNVVGTVTLSAAAPSAYYFDIQSSKPAAASVPASTAVGTGSTTRTFTITTYPVATDTPVTIRVRKQGTTDPWTESTFTVKAPKPNSCVPNPTSGSAGTVVTYTLKLDGPAPTGGLTIGLTTTDANLIAVPRNVTFASGQTQKTFTATVGASQIKKVVTVSVRYQSQTMAQGKFTYLVPEVSALTLTPNPVKGGSSVTGKITLASAAGAGGVLVPIAHYGTGISHPASVVIPAGSTQKTFTITTTAVTSTKTNKVYVKTGNVTKTVTLTVNP
ncbi:hypothetical protein EON79_11340, partial [bacterium]